MNKMKLAAGVLLVFFTGVLAGSLGTGILLKKKMETPFVSKQSKKGFLMKKLTDRLNLTEAQRVEIEKIVRENEKEIFSVQRKYLPEIQEITDRSFARMKEKLGPEQHQKLEKLHEKLERRHSRAYIQSLIEIEGDSENAVAEIRQHLNLTDEQVRKAGPIIRENIAKRRLIVEKYREMDPPPDIHSLRRELQALQESVKKDLSVLLSEEQMKEYTKIQREHRRNRYPFSSP